MRDLRALCTRGEHDYGRRLEHHHGGSHHNCGGYYDYGGPVVIVLHSKAHVHL